MPLFYSYQAYFGRYKVKTLSSGLRCIVWWELSLIMASFFIKCIALFKRKICFKALAIQWSKPVPWKWRGPVISQIIYVLSGFLIPVPWLTRSLFHFQTRVPLFLHGQPCIQVSWFFFLDSWSWRWILSFISFYAVQLLLYIFCLFPL